MLFYIVFFLFVAAIMVGIYIERVVVHRTLQAMSPSYTGPANNQCERLENFETYKKICVENGYPTYWYSISMLFFRYTYHFLGLLFVLAVISLIM